VRYQEDHPMEIHGYQSVTMDRYYAAQVIGTLGFRESHADLAYAVSHDASQYVQRSAAEALETLRGM